MVAWGFASLVRAWLVLAASCQEGGAQAKAKAKAPLSSSPPAQPPLSSRSSAGSEDQLDLISQEVNELTDLMDLAKKKISMLENLRTALTEPKLPLLAPYKRALQEKVPLMAHVVFSEDKTPMGSPDDYLVSKRILQPGAPADLIKFLTLRKSGAGGAAPSSIPSELLVVVSEKSSISLYTPTGELVVASYHAGHKEPIEHLSVSVHDEPLFMTADSSGQIRTHRVQVRPFRLTKEQKQERKLSSDEKISQFLGTQINATVEFEKEMSLRGGKVTSLTSGQQRGAKYLVVGDNEGKINIFTKNGTLKSSVSATNHPDGVQSLFASGTSVLYWAGAEMGFVNLEKADILRLRCPGLTQPVVSAIIDVQQPTKAFVSEEGGKVWVLNLKDKRACAVEHSFPKGLSASPLHLASLAGFVLGLDQPGDGAPRTLLALNLSKSESESRLAWSKQVHPLKSWSFQRRPQSGDLLALLAADGMTIEIAEVLMSAVSAPVQSGMDSFGDFKLPMIITVLVLVLGYQYMKKKQALGGGGGSDKYSKASKFGGKGAGGEPDYEEMMNKLKKTNLGKDLGDEGGGAGLDR